ncbi:MAG: RNA-binding S4 domain-containing protein [Paracoccaceae bacterium]
MIAAAPQAPRNTIRIDRWLWFARFFKSRALATKRVSGGHVRLNSVRISKPSQPVGPGDTLTFAQGERVRVVEIVATGTRRGPASEAQALYLDRTPVAETAPPAIKSARQGRPTKKQRRDLLAARRLATRRDTLE